MKQGQEQLDTNHIIEQLRKKDWYQSYSVSANYNFTDNDKIKTLLVTTAASSLTVTLPTASSNLDRVIEIMKVDTGSGSITVSGNVIRGQYQGLRFKSDGTSWIIFDVMGSGIPIGGSIIWTISTIPSGWLDCNGQAVSRTTYAALFAVISTTYGSGDGSTTFNVPDYKAAAPVGVGTSTGYTQNETIALGTKYNDQLQGFKVDGGDLGTNAGGGSGQATGKYLSIAGVGNVSVQTGAAATSAKSASPVTDGTNGTPRTGNVTRGKRIGAYYIIKY